MPAHPDKKISHMVPVDTYLNENVHFHLLGKSGVLARLDRVRKTGQLPFGKTLEELPFTQKVSIATMMGDAFSQRVLILSVPPEHIEIESENITVMGGWCVLRTQDFNNLSKGNLIDPETGDLKKISQVEQVALFIEKAIAFDQISDSIGYPSNPNLHFAAVSESQLWSEKISAKLGQVLNRKLTLTEHDQIECSVSSAEKNRHIMTEKYLRYLTGSPNLRLNRILDYDIRGELNILRDEILKIAGFGASEQSGNCSIDPESLEGAATVLSIYTGPFIDILKARGYLSPARELTYIVEPITHAWANTRASGELIKALHRSNAIYFQPGMNVNLGQIAFVESVTGDNKSTRFDLDISRVPNIHNWRELLESGDLAVDKNSTLIPIQNKLFTSAANFIGDSEGLNLLRGLIEAHRTFKVEKDKFVSLPNNGDKSKVIQGVKDDIITECVTPLNESLNTKLKEFFAELTCA